MIDDSLPPFHLSAVQRKKVIAAFDGGLISSDGGLVLLREAERRLRLAETLAGFIRDRRNQALVVHSLAAMLRFRMLAIACGYEDADACDALRADPLSKLAVGTAPESGRALCSQPTTSRLENTPLRIEVARMTAALVETFCRSFPTPSGAITLDIDDTCDPVHGHQQLSLFNAHYDTRFFLPVHFYHVESGKPVAVLLRPGKTPSGAEFRTLTRNRNMTTKDKVARRKLSLLELAKELDNVSRACKVMGYSRQQFYEIQRNFQICGAQALLDRLSGPRGPHPNRVAGRGRASDTRARHGPSLPRRVVGGTGASFEGHRCVGRRRVRGVAAP